MNMLRSWYPAGHASEYTYQLVGKNSTKIKENILLQQAQDRQKLMR